MSAFQRPWVRRCALALGLLILSGCVSMVVHQLDEAYGPARPKEYVTTPLKVAVEYERDIRPLMEKRCLACHGCYDAPCQLKLDSMQGVLRGANPEAIYSLRLTETTPARLFEDAQTTAQWRTRGFHAVVNERANTPQANVQASVMAQLLELKRANPLPAGKQLPDSFDLKLDRTQQCPAPEQMDAHLKKYPLSGMPYGLPAMSTAEHDTLIRWLSAGAPAAPLPPLSRTVVREMAEWERAFNGDSLKHQLAARYLYEHLFLAHLYLEDLGERTVYFKLVRSRTPPGQPVEQIATRRPYDEPGTPRVYYRLVRDPSSLVAKNHLPYALTPQRRAQWKTWFIDANYTVAALPGYAVKTASNPFITFEAIPIASRHAFLLDEAQFTVMNFIKGPVCRGNVALNVIRDRFWVFFTTPEITADPEYARFLAAQEAQLKLPAESKSGLLSLVDWNDYANAQRDYVKAKGEYIKRNRSRFQQAALDTFWNGNGHNSNAALTVFRHADSATVAQGLIGALPLTAWLIDYPILERIHYLLVAGYDVYGAASHQAMTRMYMDFLRMEAEMNFIAYLPKESRETEVAYWYRGATDSVREYMRAYFGTDALPTPYSTQTHQPKHDLYMALKARMSKVLNHQHDLEQSGLPPAAITTLEKLGEVRGIAASLMPESLIIKVQGHGLLTMTSNTKYSNISHMFGEAARRVVAEDTLTIASGVLTAYPNVLMLLKPSELDDFVTQVAALRSEADYSRLLDRYGVRRTDARFWALSDEVLNDYRRSEPVSAGVLDYSRYDNR